MGFSVGCIFAALLIGTLAVPTPETDQSIFFEHADVDARIVGGTQAAVGAHPHMVGLSSGLLIRNFVCGGSLLSTRTVLTAAHCIDAVFSFGSLSSSLRGTVGTNRWNQGGQSYSFSRNVTHQHYLSSTIKNDVGLLFTSTAVVLSATVQPIALTYDYVGGGVPVRAAGWGRIRNGGSLSSVLLELDAATIDGQRCVEEVERAATELNVRAPPVEPHIELCIFHSVGHGMCNGDSGSALVRLDRGTQVGVVSWGFPCARGAPDMFARVGAYMDWMLTHMV